MVSSIWVAATSGDFEKRPAGRPVQVDVEPGQPPVHTVIETDAGRVEVVVSAAIWAPPGVSPAAPMPCLRATVMPALAVVNLSSSAVSLIAAGAVPQKLAAGAGPVPVLHSPLAAAPAPGQVSAVVGPPRCCEPHHPHAF